MNPPSEQLVRDYLNRLSVAARGRLGFKDRQGLLERTRARIEVESGGLRDATEEQVRRVLAALGDPIALVEKERARIAATVASRDEVRKDEVRDAGIGGLFGGRKNGAVRHGGKVGPVQGIPAPAAATTDAATPSAAAHANGKVSAGDAGTPGSGGAAGSDFVVSSGGAAGSGGASGSDVVVSSGGLIGSGSLVGSRAVERPEQVPFSSAAAAWPKESDGEARRAGQPGQEGGPRAPGSPQADGPPARGEVSPRAPLPRRAPSADGAGGANRPPLLPGRSGRRAPDPDSSLVPAPETTHADDDSPPDQPGSGVEVDVLAMEPFEEYDDGGWPARFGGGLSVIGGMLAAWLSRLGTELVTVLVRDRLEAFAVVVLGLGGAIYPPIWIIGVIIALGSRKWDHRDKWLGLALPVFLVTFGAMLVVVLGGERHSIGQYTMEFWVAAGRLSRLAAVLGAGYLLSRAIKYQGKRVRRQPPWTQRGTSK